jgi:hypothetical protein
MVSTKNCTHTHTHTHTHTPEPVCEHEDVSVDTIMVHADRGIVANRLERVIKTKKIEKHTFG